MFYTSLKTRHLVPEVMDDPALDPASHRAALAGLARINAISRSGASIFHVIRTLSPAPDLHIVDIACGGGDIAISLFKHSSRINLQWNITGCDISPTALATAAQSARKQSANVQFLQSDVLNNPLPAADIYTTSLFLHHLTQDQVVSLLSTMVRQARVGIVISDLTRSPVALLATQIGVQLLSRSPVVHVDGPRSVRAAFTQSELSRIADAAGLTGHTIRPIWPFRALLSWRRV